MSDEHTVEYAQSGLHRQVASACRTSFSRYPLPVPDSSYACRTQSHVTSYVGLFIFAAGCPPVPTVANASPNTRDRYKRARVTYTCTSGYFFDHPSQRRTSQITCSSRGRWSSPGTCTSTHAQQALTQCCKAYTSSWQMKLVCTCSDKRTFFKSANL